jgi:hypothetical protein
MFRMRKRGPGLGAGGGQGTGTQTEPLVNRLFLTGGKANREEWARNIQSELSLIQETSRAAATPRSMALGFSLHRDTHVGLH